MKLTIKIVGLFFLGAVLLIGISAYTAIQTQIVLLQEEMAERHGQIAVAEASTIKSRLNGAMSFGYPIQTWEPGYSFVKRLVWLEPNVDEEVRPLANVKSIGNARPGELVSLLVKMDDGTERYCSYYPLKSATGRMAALEISESFARRDALTQGTVRRTLFELGALGLFSILLVWLLGVRLVGRPLEALVAKTERAAGGDLSRPLMIKGDDELSELAVVLNRMCESLGDSQQAALDESLKRSSAVEQLRHADRLKTVGRLGAGIAHELGTPLNVVIGRASLIADGKLSGDDAIASAESIRNEARRMTKLVEGLLNFARRSPAQRENCNLATIITETISLLESFAKKRSATVTARIDSADCGTINADCTQLQQVVSNLIMNAILSKENGAEVTVTLQRSEVEKPFAKIGDRQLSMQHDSASRQCLVLEVGDNGDGIAPEHRNHLFEPFFTTRQTGEGTGLGLSMVYGIVKQSGGYIYPESEVGKGTTFRIFLPRHLEDEAEKAAALAEAEAAAAAAHKGKSDSGKLEG